MLSPVVKMHLFSNWLTRLTDFLLDYGFRLNLFGVWINLFGVLTYFDIIQMIYFYGLLW